MLSEKEKRNVYLLLFPAIITAFLNVVGVAFIAPFVAVASDPKAIAHYEKLAWVYHSMHFETQRGFLLFLGVAVLIILILVNSLNAFTYWSTSYVILHARASMATRLLTYYLSKPYVFFLDHNSASLMNNIFELVNRVTTGVLQACIGIVTAGLVILLIVSLLVIVNPLMALGSMLIIGGAYGAIYISIRRKLNIISKHDVVAEEGSHLSVSESFGGIKDIKLFGCESQFIQRFSMPQYALAKNRALFTGMQHVPKYALEVVAFGGVISLIIYMLSINKDFSAIMPTIALYVFAGYKLMPVIQQLFVHLTSLKSSYSALDVLYACLGGQSASSNDEEPTPKKLLQFNDRLELVKLSFMYPSSERLVLNAISLNIKVNTTVGFIGTTGSGKTTLIDLILGLLTPTHGNIYVDGIEITSKNLQQWQRSLGYVPQHIYLCDNSIACNIAFGVPHDKIDMSAVMRAAKLAAIDDFVVSKLPNGYETVIGERGVRLSGGQRQRIGIARALYHDPSILILDEATSALDGTTEDVIMEAIRNLGHKKTIVIVAHRLSTVAECDHVYLLEDGEIIDQGVFSELAQRNSHLQQVASPC